MTVGRKLQSSFGKKASNILNMRGNLIKTNKRGYLGLYPRVYGISTAKAFDFPVYALSPCTWGCLLVGSSHEPSGFCRSL